MNRPDWVGKSECVIFIDSLPNALRRAADFIETDNPVGVADDAQIYAEGPNEDGAYRVILFFDANQTETEL